MPSSVRFGSRPRNPTIRSYSSRREAVAFENLGIDHAGCCCTKPSGRKRSPATINDIEDHEAVDAAEERLARALGMRHHADDVARLVAEAGDGVDRSVRIPRIVQPPVGIGVAKDHLAVRFELAQQFRRREVVALAVADRNPQHLADAGRRRERRVDLLDADVHVLAAVLQPAVAQHRAGQQPGLEQNLKPVADAEHRTAALGERPHRRP